MSFYGFQLWIQIRILFKISKKKNVSLVIGFYKELVARRPLLCWAKLKLLRSFIECESAQNLILSGLTFMPQMSRKMGNIFSFILFFLSFLCPALSTIFMLLNKAWTQFYFCTFSVIHPRASVLFVFTHFSTSFSFYFYLNSYSFKKKFSACFWMILKGKIFYHRKLRRPRLNHDTEPR